MLPHRTSYATQHHHTRVHHGTHTMVPRSHHRDLLTCTCTASAEHTQQPQTQQPQIHLQRRLLLTLTAGLSMATPLLTSPPRASAYILDEDNASNVFTAAAPSVVGIIDLKVERNGEEVLEGVGSGLVWDKYGYATAWVLMRRQERCCIVQYAHRESVHNLPQAHCYQLPLHITTSQRHHWKTGCAQATLTNCCDCTSSIIPHHIPPTLNRAGYTCGADRQHGHQHPI